MPIFRIQTLEESFGAISRPHQRRGRDIAGAFQHPAVKKSMEVNLKVIATLDVLIDDLEPETCPKP